MDQYQKKFMKEVQRIAGLGGMRDYDVMRKFIDCTYIALSNGALALLDKAGIEGAKAKWDKQEEEYLQIMGTVHKLEERQGIAGLMGIVVEALEEKTYDFLSEPYMETMSDAKSGQFFTPWHLCKMMAHMTMGDINECLDAEKGPVWVSEPACGSGGMVLAIAEVAKEQNVNPATRLHFVCTDINSATARACYIQLTLAGISAEVRTGNTLTDEVWESNLTMAAVMHPKRPKLDKPKKTGRVRTRTKPVDKKALSGRVRVRQQDGA